jgi:hypothetical protein
MKRLRIVVAFLVGSCLLPCAARGALSLGIVPSATFPPPGVPFSTPLPMDLIFHETGTVEREGLFTYDIALDLVPPGGSAPLGVRFMTGPSAVQVVDPAAIARTNAAGQPAEPSITVLESTPQRLLFNITSAGELSDIDDGEIGARVFYTFEPGGRIGYYRVLFDAQNTVFGSGDPNLPLSIPVALIDAVPGIFYPPEPSTLALVGMASVLTLRRRRPAR